MGPPNLERRKATGAPCNAVTLPPPAREPAMPYHRKTYQRAQTILEKAERSELHLLVSNLLATPLSPSEAETLASDFLLLVVLERNKGNVCKAARDFGMHRNTFSRRLDFSFRRLEAMYSRGIRRIPPASALPIQAGFLKAKER